MTLEDKKIFLVASASEKKLLWLSEMITKHVSGPTIFTASDGVVAVSKIKHAAPHVLITDLELPKVTGLQLVDAVLQSKECAATAIIMIGPPPEKGHHLDELVTGKLQYILHDGDETELNHCLAKALNTSSHNKEAEFYMKFLAPGDVLLKEGERAEFVYFVKKGKLKAIKIAQGVEHHLGDVDYGEFVGEMAYVNGEPRSATVTALSDCELIEVPIGTFAKVLFKRPAWSKALMLTLSKRVKAANESKLKV